MNGKRIRLIGLFIVASLAVLGTWQWPAIQAWWYVKQLSQASEANREERVAHVAALGEAAVPRLVFGLNASTEETSISLECGMIAVAKPWKLNDPRTFSLIQQLRDRYGSMGAAGQASALRTAAAVFNQAEMSERIDQAMAEQVGAIIAAAKEDATLRPEMLRLTAALLNRIWSEEWASAGRGFAIEGFRHADVTTRVAALHLALCECVRTEPTVLTAAVPLLRDQAAEVRKAALLVLGSASELVSEDELLPLLHDADPEVVQTCELTLRGRGLQDSQLALAKLISDDRPAARLQILQHLRAGSDVDAGVWLRRLSHDPAPAVRAAAVRAAARVNVDLRDRLREITQQDSSPTVRELADHYLRTQKE